MRRAPQYTPHRSGVVAERLPLRISAVAGAGDFNEELRGHQASQNHR